MGGLNFSALDQAMAQFEGFGSPGTIATRQNNPGNLQFGSYAVGQGAVGEGTNGIAIFPDARTGFQAMDNLVGHYADQGLTLQEMLNKWAPPNAPGNTPASTQNYVNSVASQTGVNPNAPVSGGNSISNSNAPDWMKSFYQSMNDLTGLGTQSTPAMKAAAAKSSSSSGLFGSLFSGFSFSRIGTFALGLILIAGGLYLFGAGTPIQIATNALRKK
jgi:hypothetical protein